MRNTMKALRIMVMGFIVMMALIGCASAAGDTPNEHVIQTTGTGNVITTPDRAQVTFAVQTENSDVKLAQAENAVKMAKVHDALIAAGIPRDALKTTGYNIWPVYEESTGFLKPKIKTYQVTNRLTVTLHDINRTGEVIDTAVASGINEADSIQFMISDEKTQEVRTEALQQAVSRARSDADTISAAMGTTIKGVQRAETSSSCYPVYFQNYALDSVSAKGSAETPIQSGDITVSASVTITYLI